MRRLRDLVGDLGWWVLLAVAIPIHIATVVIAFQWYSGWKGLVAAGVSAVVPALPEIFWAVRTALARDTVAHWYVLAVIGYPILWAVWIVGGMLFGVDRTPRR